MMSKVSTTVPSTATSTEALVIVLTELLTIEKEMSCDCCDDTYSLTGEVSQSSAACCML